MRYCREPSDGATVVNLVKNYAAQYAAAKSLPFTASEYALDCVSAAVTTVAGGKTPRESAIKTLRSAGHHIYFTHVTHI